MGLEVANVIMVGFIMVGGGSGVTLNYARENPEEVKEDRAVDMTVYYRRT